MPINRARMFVQNLPLLGARQRDLTAQDVVVAREYIKNYWPKVTRSHPKDDDSLVGLPNPYLVPSLEEGHEFDFNEMYYWDSYFMAQGIMDNEHRQLVIGIVEDLVYMCLRFGIIPNASRTYLTGRSQPPFLSSFILEVYKAYGLDNKWLESNMAVAQAEYQNVWMGTVKPNARQVYEGLSRYYDINYLNDLAETESGWDMTPRFNRRVLEYLPVDLNSLLYKYETDFSETAKILGNGQQASRWEIASNRRKNTMNDLMWSDMRGLFYDYNFAKKKRGTVSSLAAYYPMWAGLASESQAAKLVGNLRKFERRGGLATTDATQVGQLFPGAVPTQWAYPNGWAPLHFIVVKGLQRYGYNNDAKRIAMKWLKCNLDWFNKHGVFLEKYNVAQPEKPPLKGVYPSQTGFGWTNAVFEKFCQEFIDKK